jgi:hypothetical protein
MLKYQIEAQWRSLNIGFGSLRSSGVKVIDPKRKLFGIY